MATTLESPEAISPGLLSGSEQSSRIEPEVITMHGTVEAAGIPVEYTIESAPDVVQYEGFGIIAPGFGGFKRTSRDLGHQLALAGITTARYTPVRRDDHCIWSRLSNSQQAHADTITAVAEDIAGDENARARLPNIDFDRRILLPHSMGGLATTQHAREAPSGKTEAIINLASAGFGTPNLPQLAETVPKGLHKAIFQELIPFITSGKIDVTPLNFWRFVHYYGVNPARTVGEIYACLSTDVRPEVWALGKQGVRSAFIAFEHDSLIPPNEDLHDTVDYYEVMPDAGHMAPQLKAERVAKAISDAIDVLDIAA